MGRWAEVAEEDGYRVRGLYFISHNTQCPLMACEKGNILMSHLISEWHIVWKAKK